MPMVDLGVSVLRLYVDPHYKPIKQKKRTFSKEKGEAIRVESPQLLARLVIGDILQIYLAVSESALSSVLIWEEEKVQRRLYYVIRVMRGAEMRYPLTEKLVYALIIAARKLKPYFEAHLVEVITDQPLRQILDNPSRSLKIVKWVIELSEFDLRHKPRTSIKGQALADFMVECTHEPGERAPKSINLVEATE
ncbi:hypothetical protein LIER_14756 [Lithospermum erythrorhizon]|uniref:Reverse transcriptase RNase H-like domain-containing protein n=1 Tax=Lithospermum erythrorhizon TaxID=34254 RepID=A0AAV3Q2U7_LITER